MGKVTVVIKPLMLYLGEGDEARGIAMMWTDKRRLELKYKSQKTTIK